MPPRIPHPAGAVPSQPPAGRAPPPAIPPGCRSAGHAPDAATGVSRDYGSPHCPPAWTPQTRPGCVAQPPAGRAHAPPGRSEDQGAPANSNPTSQRRAEILRRPQPAGSGQHGLRPTALHDPYGDEPPGSPGPPGYSSGPETRGCGNAGGYSADRCACSRQCSVNSRLLRSKRFRLSRQTDYRQFGPSAWTTADKYYVTVRALGKSTQNTHIPAARTPHRPIPGPSPQVARPGQFGYRQSPVGTNDGDWRPPIGPDCPGACHRTRDWQNRLTRPPPASETR